MVYNSSANRIYAGGSGSDRIAVVDAATGARVARIATPAGEGIISLCYNPASNKLYAATYVSTAKLLVIDGTTNGVLATVPVNGYVHSMRVNPATDRVYCVNSGVDSVTVIDGTTNGVVKTVKVGDYPYALCVNTTNNRVYCAGLSDSSVTVIDGATDSVVATVRTGRGPQAL
jgi:YVTN family beta-propeller protein